MDSTMKIKNLLTRPILFGLLSLLLLPLSSCKEHGWVDWKTQNEIWLENNKTKSGVKVTESGLQYWIEADPMASSHDARPNTTSTIICDYDLYLINGFFGEYNPANKALNSGRNVSLTLSSTIPGFSEGCHKIHNQGDIWLYIPAYLGYDSDKYDEDKYDEAEGNGTEGTSSYIPPYSTLIYRVHISSVVGN